MNFVTQFLQVVSFIVYTIHFFHCLLHSRSFRGVSYSYPTPIVYGFSKSIHTFNSNLPAVWDALNN